MNAVKLYARILGCLQPGTIDILVGYDSGMADGYIYRREVNKIPLTCRMPNTFVWVTLLNKEIIAVEKYLTEP